MTSGHERTPELIKRLQNGDSAALEDACEVNLPLVHAIAKRFVGRGIEQEDLVQLGMIGLIKALRGFDLTLDFRFSTYAVPLIMGEMRRALRDDGPIHVARSLKEASIKLMRARDELSVDGREPTVEQLARHCDMQLSEAVLALDSLRPIHSLNEPASDSDDREAAHFLHDPRALIPGDDGLEIRDAVRTLPERERLLIALRFYRGLTQAETARRLGISQVQVSRLEKRILTDLRGKLA